MASAVPVRGLTFDPIARTCTRAGGARTSPDRYRPHALRTPVQLLLHHRILAFAIKSLLETSQRIEDDEGCCIRGLGPCAHVRLPDPYQAADPRDLSGLRKLALHHR